MQVALGVVEDSYRARHPKSAACNAEAALYMPGGNTRTAIYYSPFPLTWIKGVDNRLTDIDGLEYLDLLGEYSAGLYGHSNIVVQAAIKQALNDGTVLGGPNQYEAKLAEAIRQRFPSIDLLRFTNSGTEANLMALSTMRALQPKRPRVMVFDGGYHGGVFYFRNGSAPLNAPFDWLIAAYNDIEGTRALLRTHAATISTVLVEPMLGGGCIPATLEFLTMLRTECSSNDIVLIFDEVMTSRLSPSGLQGLFGIKPDLTTLGKYLGGGLSFGAFGGRRDIMERFDPTRPDSFDHAGTFNNNVLSMAGGLAGLTQVFTRIESTRINTLGEHLRARLNAVARSHAVPFQATGIGSLIGLHFSAGIICKPADAEHRTPGVDARKLIETLFHLDMLNRGFYFSRRGYIALSLPTTEVDIERFVAAVDDFMATHAALINSGTKSVSALNCASVTNTRQDSPRSA